jgi:transposase InsO family protein
MVVRDIPVRRAISRSGNVSRKAIRLMMFKSPMCITPMSSAAHGDGGRVTWVNSQWKVCRYLGHFRVEIYSKGNCYDNAAVETFFKTIKAELIWRDTWETRRQAEMAIFEYINGFYNPRCCHSTLGWKSPVAFERKVA